MIQTIAVASFTNYSDSLDPQNELVISAVYEGQNLSQTVPLPGFPCMVFFNPANVNFYATTDLTQVAPGDLLVKIITALS